MSDGAPHLRDIAALNDHAYAGNMTGGRASRRRRERAPPECKGGCERRGQRDEPRPAVHRRSARVCRRWAWGAIPDRCGAKAPGCGAASRGKGSPPAGLGKPQALPPARIRCIPRQRQGRPSVGFHRFLRSLALAGGIGPFRCFNSFIDYPLQMTFQLRTARSAAEQGLRSKPQ